MKNKIISGIIISAILYYGSGNIPGTRPAKAQTSERNATPEVTMETGAKLLITEVNLKNKEADWLEFYYESPAEKPLNLKNFGFQDDTLFKKIATDYWVKSGEYTIVVFKSTEPDSEQNHFLSTSRSGLTATTEQIMMKTPGGKIIDAICWANTKPTSDELKDMEELFQEEGWISSSPDSCFDSSKISTNQSLARTSMTDTDSSKDWTVTDDTTRGFANDKTPQTAPPNPPNGQSTTAPQKTVEEKPHGNQTPATTGKISGTEKNTGSQNPKKSSKTSPATSTTKVTAAKKSSTETKKTPKAAKKTTQKRNYHNGDNSEFIRITEVFAHAAKEDKKNEWIELTNTGEKKISMGNWKLDDDEGGSKPYTLPDTLIIEPGTSIIIKAPESKLSLANTRDVVRLYNPAGELMQSVEYEEAPKETSYALIIIQKEDGSTEEQWVWDKHPTPELQNPIYHQFAGTIATDAEFTEPYHFTLQTQNQQTYTVTFEEETIQGPLAKAAFIKRAQLVVTGILDPSGTSLELRQYEITAATQPTGNETSPWVWLSLLPPGSAGFWYGFKKIRKHMVQ